MSPAGGEGAAAKLSATREDAGATGGRRVLLVQNREDGGRE